MRTVDIIEAKRDNRPLPPEALTDFVNGVVAGRVPDYQAAAFLMAVYFRGMHTEELVAYAKAMLYSGATLSMPSLKDRYKVDKHSTGGVGDKVSITLAPLVAACGPVIPMISGRGLGHTGGTLDKIEAIEGMNVELSAEDFERCVSDVGYAIAGQTAELVPADKKLYALRDVTGTVPSIPLIAASIMSKKLAAGLDGLVLDVKTGSGAFMKSFDDAATLAQTMIAIGEGMGCRTRACVTSMEQPLGRAVGHSNEMVEAFAALRGEGPKDYLEVCMALGVEMLQLALGVSADAARASLRAAIDSGRALEHCRRWIEAQGGNPRVIDEPYKYMPRAPHERMLEATVSGYLNAFDCAEVGRACGILGGGRATASDKIDHAVGIEVLAKLGDRIDPGTPLFSIAYRDEDKAKQAEALLRQAIIIKDSPCQAPSLLRAQFSKASEEASSPGKSQ